MNKSNKTIIVVSVITITIISILVINWYNNNQQYEKWKDIEHKKLMDESNKVLESGKKLIKENNELLCSVLMQEYKKNPNGPFTLDMVINSDPCKNK